MKKLIYALRFMTVIPIKWKEGEDMGEVARSITFFPIVGLIIGLVISGVYTLSIMIFSPFLTSVIVIICWIVITGALHLDGLSDTFDGVWGGTTKERRLEIMKDSRTGVFGVVALIGFLLLKTASMSELISFHDDKVYTALLCAPVIGRWISVFSIFYFPSARKKGLGVFFKENIAFKELLVTLVITLIIVFVAGGFSSLSALIIITIISYLFSLFFKSRLGGLTGDVYGALCESGEFLTIMVLLFL